MKLASEQRKPAIDLVVNYGARGVGGTKILRSDALGGSATGTIPGGYFDALSSLAGMNFPTWSLRLNVTMPIGKKAADAAHARGVVERRQADLRLESLQLQVAADVTRSAEAIRTAKEEIEAVAAVRQLAQRWLEAETARRDAGLVHYLSGVAGAARSGDSGNGGAPGASGLPNGARRLRSGPDGALGIISAVWRSSSRPSSWPSRRSPFWHRLS